MSAGSLRLIGVLVVCAATLALTMDPDAAVNPAYPTNPQSALVDADREAIKADQEEVGAAAEALRAAQAKEQADTDREQADSEKEELPSDKAPTAGAAEEQKDAEAGAEDQCPQDPTELAAAINANEYDPFPFVTCQGEATVSVDVVVKAYSTEPPVDSQAPAVVKEEKISSLYGRRLANTVNLYKGLAVFPDYLPITYRGHMQRWFASRKQAAGYDKIGALAAFNNEAPTGDSVFLLDLVRRENILAVAELMNRLEEGDVPAMAAPEAFVGLANGGMHATGAELDANAAPFLLADRRDNFGVPTLALNKFTKYFLKAVGGDQPWDVRALVSPQDDYYPMGELYQGPGGREQLVRRSTYQFDFPAFKAMCIALEKAGLSSTVAGYYMTPLHGFHGEIMLCDGYNAHQTPQSVAEVSERCEEQRKVDRDFAQCRTGLSEETIAAEVEAKRQESAVWAREAAEEEKRREEELASMLSNNFAAKMAANKARLAEKKRLAAEQKRLAEEAAAGGGQEAGVQDPVGLRGSAGDQ